MRRYGLLLMALWAAAAWGYPTLNAMTGIVTVPTADMDGTVGVSVAADAIFTDDTTVNARVVGALLGMLEVGAGYETNGEQTNIVSAKIRFPGDYLGFRWAAGGTWRSVKDGDKGTQLFLVGSRTLDLFGAVRTPLSGTIGIHLTDIDGNTGLREFLGLQLRFGSTTLAAEHVFSGGDFDKAITSVVLRQQLTRGLTIQGGFTDAIGFVGTGDQTAFVGASIGW